VPNELILWDSAKKAIAAAHCVDEVKQIRDKAEAYRYALRLAGEAPAVIRQAEEIKVRAERRAGEMLRDQGPAHGGDRKSESRSEGSTLNDLDVTRDESSTWQRIAEIPEEQFEQFIAKAPEITTAGILRIAKSIEREQQIEEIRNSEITTPSGIYDVIVYDPPWPYGTKYDANGRRAANPYPEQSLADISNTIPGIIRPADNSILWLWTTHKFLHEAFHLIAIWGFQDVAVLTWVKNKIGLGSWLRSQSEFCIMAKKGKPTVTLTNQSTILIADAREHSRKPDEFYGMVQELCPGRRVDYPAREKREGFEVGGNETEKFE
jgi:N6-adenosine-specific RNA methylase IME4